MRRNNSKQQQQKQKRKSSSSSVPVVTFFPRGNNRQQQSQQQQSSSRSITTRTNQNNNNLAVPAQVLLQLLRQQQHHHRQKRRQRDEEEDEEVEEIEEEDDDDDAVSEAIALASILSGQNDDEENDDDDDNDDELLVDDEEGDDDEYFEDDDDKSSSSDESKATTVISIRNNSEKGKRKKQENGGGDELIIQAEIDESNPLSRREIVGHITNAAAGLLAVCPNFSSLRVVVPPSSQQSKSSQTTLILPPRDVSKFSPEKLSVVIDLDETIVQSRGLHESFVFSNNNNKRNSNNNKKNNNNHDVLIVARPHLFSHLIPTLQRIGAEIIVWTAAQKEYAEYVLKFISSSHYHQNNNETTQTQTKWWHHLIAREDCLTHRVWNENSELFPKNLSWIVGGTAADSSSNRSLNKCLLLENSPASVFTNPENCFLVSDFHNYVENVSVDDQSLIFASQIIEQVSNNNTISVSRALGKTNLLELCSFRVPGVRGLVQCKTLVYSPPGVPRTFGEEKIKK
jgi:hypothetical protein